jgi:hypothetical protein
VSVTKASARSAALGNCGTTRRISDNANTVTNVVLGMGVIAEASASMWLLIR